MFTGIVQEVGRVRHRDVRTDGARFTIAAPKTIGRLSIGESIAVNGVCLTVVELDGETFSADAVPQTLRTTTLGHLEPGSPVNLEPPLRAGDPLGGHWVMGHVDGTGVVLDVTPEGNSLRVQVQPPADLMPYFIPKGSVCVEGVSLTLADVGRDRFAVVLVPHTRAVTTLGTLKAGQRVNIEVDVLGKYIANFAAPYLERWFEAGAPVKADKPEKDA